jgi:hypothetical protein
LIKEDVQFLNFERFEKMLLLINSCNKRRNFFTSNMSFRMSPDDTVACVSSEGPGPSPGGIAGHTNADQTSEGPSLKTWGIAGSAVTGKDIKHKLDTKSYKIKYDAIVTAGISSSKFRSSCLPFVVKQTTLPVFS